MALFRRHAAGAFLCNHISYCALDWLAANGPIPFGFVHVPKWRPDGDLSIAAIVEIVSAAIAALQA